MASEQRNSFTFEWRIEKFAYFQEVEPSYYVSSPRFHAVNLDTSSWNLKLYPNGRHKGDPHIGLTFGSLSNISFDCEWSILGSDGSPLSEATVKNKFIDGGGSLDLPDGPLSERVFVTLKNAFIPSGNLTLRFRVWGSDRDLAESECVFGCTQIDVRMDSYKWCIENFSHTQLNKPLKNVAGVNFSSCTKCPVATNLTLRGESLEDSTVEYEVVLNELESPLWMKIKLLILDSDEKVMKSHVISRIFETFRTQHTTRIWTIQNLVSRREILAKCLRDDVLTMRFEMGIIPQYSSFVERTVRGEENAESRLSVGTFRDDGGHHVTPKLIYSIVSLSEELGVAFENHTLSDFELRSGDASFSAHKIVLSARSRVFRDMFCDETIISNFMDVPDVDPITLETMLRYLYTGIVADLQWEGAIMLYYAAHKFQVLSLKRECWNVLKTDMNVTNVFEVLELADSFNDTEMTSIARDFISDHFDDVTRTPAWDSFLVTHSYLAGKTLSEIHSRKTEELEFLNRCA